MRSARLKVQLLRLDFGDNIECWWLSSSATMTFLVDSISPAQKLPLRGFYGGHSIVRVETSTRYEGPDGP